MKKLRCYGSFKKMFYFLKMYFHFQKRPAILNLKRCDYISAMEK